MIRAGEGDWPAYATRQREGYIVGPEPDIPVDEFERVEFAVPRDSGRKVWLATISLRPCRPVTRANDLAR